MTTYTAYTMHLTTVTRVKRVIASARYILLSWVGVPVQNVILEKLPVQNVTFSYNLDNIRLYVSIPEAKQRW